MAQRLGTVVHSCWHSASTLVGTVLGTLVGTVLGTLDHQNQPQILTVLDWLKPTDLTIKLAKINGSHYGTC